MINKKPHVRNNFTQAKQYNVKISRQDLLITIVYHKYLLPLTLI